MERLLQIYYTADIHGHIYPVDYATGEPGPLGLLNLATQLEKDGNTLILDGGDTLQGTPFSQYYLDHSGDFDFQPMALAFNAAGFDYVTLGNHDFNYGYAALHQYLKALDARCLCANVRDLWGELNLLSETVHTMDNGLRVGITGIVTDFVTVWESPANLAGLQITDAFEAAREACRRLRPLCDVCVCIYHGGFERDLESGRPLSDSGENIAWKICEQLDFDLLLTGHQHMGITGARIGGTYAVQPPANAGQFVSVNVTENEGSLQVKSCLMPVGVIHQEEPYQTMYGLEQAVQNWLDLPVGALGRPIAPERKLEAALNGSRVASLFNLVQLEATGADFSCTSLGNEPVGLSTPVTMRGITAAYLFPNTLVVLEVDEDVLRSALERSAAYFVLENGSPTVSGEFLRPKIEHYNYDFYAGLSYAFDLRRPVGERVTKLMRSDGSPLGKGPFRLCTSNYRATGTGGYEALGRCRVLWRGNVEMPELVAKYIRTHSPLELPDKSLFTVSW